MAADLSTDTPAARRPVYPAMRCPECGHSFNPHHHRQAFCTTEHKRAFEARQKQRGQKIAMVAQGWRLGRNVKRKDPRSLALKSVASDAFTDLCRVLDAFAAEDVAAGRPPALEVLQRQYAMGQKE